MKSCVSVKKKGVMSQKGESWKKNDCDHNAEEGAVDGVSGDEVLQA